MACIWLPFLLHLFFTHNLGSSIWQISIRGNTSLFYFVSVPGPLAQTSSQKCPVLSLPLGRKMDTNWYKVSCYLCSLVSIHEGERLNVPCLNRRAAGLVWKPDKPGQAPADTPCHSPFRFHSILFCNLSLIYLKCIIGGYFVGFFSSKCWLQLCTLCGCVNLCRIRSLDWGSSLPWGFWEINISWLNFFLLGLLTFFLF